MSKKLFQNDSITGNSLIGFEIKGTFKKKEDELMLLLSSILNREILDEDDKKELFRKKVLQWLLNHL